MKEPMSQGDLFWSREHKWSSGSDVRQAQYLKVLQILTLRCPCNISRYLRGSSGHLPEQKSRSTQPFQSALHWYWLTSLTLRWYYRALLLTYASSRQHYVWRPHRRLSTRRPRSEKAALYSTALNGEGTTPCAILAPRLGATAFCFLRVRSYTLGKLVECGHSVSSLFQSLASA